MERNIEKGVDCCRRLHCSTLSMRFLYLVNIGALKSHNE